MWFLKELSIAKDESIPVLVQFDPSYKEDNVIRTTEKFLQVSFGDHPQKVCLHLVEQYVIFSNVKAE